MALKDFMPYGASELLADQDRRMARASASATALLVTVFAALMLALPRMQVIAAPTPEIDPTIIELWKEPPPLEPTSAPSIPPTPQVTPIEQALPEPVPDSLALAPVVSQRPETTSGPEAGEPGGSSTPSGEPGGGADPGTVEPVPGIGDFVIVDEYPALVSSPDAVYPDIAREAGVEGRVVVRMLVGRDGRVKDAVVDARHSVPMLDGAALAAARASVFTPALTNGHTVAVWVARPYDFRLH